MPDVTDPELRALQGGIDLLANLEPAMRRRVLVYLCRRFDSEILDTTHRWDLLTPPRKPKEDKADA